ncbi:MAG TPA: prepilin-type N-terminal cleavage/methylation domain-containing protein [Terracidiphilus sp.]|nr:prepilin-type N-terminal cleavage/methylation domain-containing protein [Terracidiphilus sp.]
MNRKLSLCPGRRGSQGYLLPDGSRRPNGFTLMELLIVMAIITILMLLAIPTTQKLFKHSHELSAKKSLQTIQQVQTMYESDYPSNGFACNLAYLGGDPSAGPPSPTSAQMLPQDLASGFKSGYIFAIGNCTKMTANGTDRVTSYTVTAVPATVGKSGDLGFCLDQYGAIKSDPAGGTNCTQLVQ